LTEKNNNKNISHCTVSRRDLLALGLLTAASAVLPVNAFAAQKEPSCKELNLYNANTHEHLHTVYWKDGVYLPDELEKINHIFRDFHTGTEKDIDINLLDLLCELKGKLKCKDPYHIVSGYRTPRTNALLRKRNLGAAKKSLHMFGKAVDIRIPGYSLRGMRRVAMKIHAGGVGYYPTSKFLHLDVGEVRYWWG
jgi:uncharacterized protein YcbK (DUF882 family)